MECQVCNGTITPKKVNDIEIFSCKNCNGFWIKKGNLNKLIKHQSGDIEFSSIDHHIHTDTHGIMKCAFCTDQAMIKSNFIEYSDIILDYCEKCGAFWIDGGEIEKMQKYMNSLDDSSTKSSIIEIIFKALYSLPK
jgi:Zn-finger nucleic acid-binding protein